MQMKSSLFALCLLSAALAACGGGGGADSATATSRAFVVPTAGTILVVDETLNDNLNNTINRTLVETVSEVHADGSFVTTESDPSNNTVHLGLENYTVYPAVIDHRNNGHTKQIVTSYPDGTSRTCVFSPADPPSSPNFTYTETCGTSNPVTHTQSGSYLGTETITVPAGTFNTDKFQTTDSWVNSDGATVTETTIKWSNLGVPESALIKRVSNFAYSGAATRPNSIVSLTGVLHSWK
jgi:hypothetical protein